MSTLLDMKNITKSFPGVKALECVDFTLEAGEIHCLIGANGAGKSTLMKILSGVYEKDGGTITFEGKDVQIKSPSDSQMLGISTIHQELSLVEELSVAENIFLGKYNKKGNGFINWNKLNRKAADILKQLEEEIPSTTTVSELSMGKKQMVEIAKAIAIDTKVLIMDEPSTALSEDEVIKLFKVIREVKKQGITIVYISHKLNELYQIGERVTVLRNGKNVYADDLEKITQSELIQHITGREILKMEKKTTASKKDIYLKVENFTNHKLNQVSFELGKGEVLGLYGLVGSGRTELLRALYGADPVVSGNVELDKKKVNITSPKHAVELGMGMVPENRKTEGVFLDLPIDENVALPSLDNHARFMFIKGRKVNQLVNNNIKKMNVKANNAQVMVRNLSGGNQQKIIISKWLMHESKIMLFDEPTQGIDVGAKDEIYQIIESLTKEKGTSVIVASSEIDELLTICNRVLVMYEGEVIDEFIDPVNNKSEIMNAAVSGE